MVGFSFAVQEITLYFIDVNWELVLNVFFIPDVYKYQLIATLILLMYYSK